MNFEEIIKTNQDYIENKYSKIYFEIIEKRIKCPATIGEKHHVLPKSLYQGYRKIVSNIVKLTTREHFICHRLLIKMFVYKSESFRKMSWAIHRMSDRFAINSREYEIIRKIHSKNIKLTKGRKSITDGISNKFIRPEEPIPDGWYYGITRSEEHEEKLAKHRQNRKPCSEETKLKISLANKGMQGKECSEETKQKLSNSLKGREITWNDKLKKAHALRKEKIENGEISKPIYAKKSTEVRRNMGKEYEVYNPNGELFIVKNLKMFALENNLCINALIKSYVNNKPVPAPKVKFTENRINVTGWSVKII